MQVVLIGVGRGRSGSMMVLVVITGITWAKNHRGIDDGTYLVNIMVNAGIAAGLDQMGMEPILVLVASRIIAVNGTAAETPARQIFLMPCDDRFPRTIGQSHDLAGSRDDPG
jgi:hypothetical protein